MNILRSVGTHEPTRRRFDTVLAALQAMQRDRRRARVDPSFAPAAEASTAHFDRVWNDYEKARGRTR